MTYYDDEASYSYDKQLAEYIGESLSKDIESKYASYNHNRTEECVIIVRLYKLKDSERKSEHEGYDEYDLCHDCCEEIRLIDTCCSYETLLRSVEQVHLKDFYYAKIETPLEEEDSSYQLSIAYLFFKYPNKINFGHISVSEKARLSYSTSEDFEKKFKNRNLDIKLEEYKRLIRNRDDYKKSYDRYIKEIEDFKKGLTEEELLAISVVDQ